MTWTLDTKVYKYLILNNSIFEIDTLLNYCSLFSVKLAYFYYVELLLKYLNYTTSKYVDYVLMNFNLLFE